MAADEVLRLVPGDLTAMPSPVTAPRNGTVLRTVYDRRLLTVPAARLRVAERLAAGEQARVASDVPAALVIVDGRVALEDGRDDPALARLGRIAFEAIWERARPLTGERPSGEALDLQIVDLLAQGMIDEGVAQRLSLSTRTVRRRVAHLMRELGAATRFQAGYLAAQREAAEAERVD